MAYPIMLEESIAKSILRVKKIRTEWAQLLPWVNATPHPSELPSKAEEKEAATRERNSSVN